LAAVVSTIRIIDLPRWIAMQAHHLQAVYSLNPRTIPRIRRAKLLFPNGTIKPRLLSSRRSLHPSLNFWPTPKQDRKLRADLGSAL